MVKSLDIVKAELARTGTGLVELAKIAHYGGYRLRQQGMAAPDDASSVDVVKRIESLCDYLDGLRSKHPNEPFLSTGTGRIEVSRLLEDGEEEIQISFSLVTAYKED